MAAWLETFPWVWFLNLTLRPGFSEPKAWSCLHRWLGEVRGQLDDGNFGHFVSRELGSTKENLHFHGLLMGLKDSGAEARLEWMQRWNKLAGDALITAFTANAGGILYILKDVDPNDPRVIEFDIQEQTRMQSTLECK